jgi:predicted CopG family antitoxin
MEETTTIRISKKMWKELNSLKETGNSFEDVLIKLLSFIKNNNTLNNINVF